MSKIPGLDGTIVFSRPILENRNFYHVGNASNRGVIDLNEDKQEDLAELGTSGAAESKEPTIDRFNDLAKFARNNGLSLVTEEQVGAITLSSVLTGYGNGSSLKEHFRPPDANTLNPFPQAFPDAKSAIHYDQASDSFQFLLYSDGKKA
jgi:hypothetical protein